MTRRGWPIGRELDLSVGQRLAVGFGLLLLVLATFAGTVFVWHTRSANAQRDYLERIAPLNAHAEGLERAMLYVGLSLRSYIFTPNPQQLANYRRRASEAQQALQRVAAAASKEMDGQELFANIVALTRPYLAEADRLVALRASGPPGPQEEANLIERRELALSAVYRLIDLQNRKTKDALEQMAVARDRVSQGLLALSVIGALLFLAVAYFTTQSIRRPTRALVSVAGALERGDWTPALSLAPRLGTAAPSGGTGRSEMRKLSRAIGAAATSLEHRERELREKNERIRAQNEELHLQYSQIQTQNEELQAQNEEIQSQSEELHAQTEELQSQSEELKAQNEELTQQSVELRAHGDALAEANERTNHFLGVLAHELRNPLAPISNSIFVMKRVAAGSEPALRAQAVIERQTRHMVRLVDDLLDITRISKGKIRVQREPLDLAATLSICLEDQHGTLEQSGLTLEVSLPAEPVRVRGDHTRLSQVFGNLLSNAVKFTKAGGTISLHLHADTQNREAVLRVADTGIGMDATLLPLLFRPFSQGASGYAHSSGGLGLGLALVKALVELHDGTVVASSAGANQGSEFIVRLPLDTGQPAAA